MANVVSAIPAYFRKRYKTAEKPMIDTSPLVIALDIEKRRLRIAVTALRILEYQGNGVAKDALRDIRDITL